MYQHIGILGQFTIQNVCILTIFQLVYPPKQTNSTLLTLQWLIHTMKTWYLVEYICNCLWKAYRSNQICTIQTKNTGLNDLISYVASFPSNIVPLGHERKIGFFVFKTIFDCQILKLFIGHIQKAD